MTTVAMQDIKKGAIFGQWRLVEKIGYGGNAQVWKVTDSTKNIAALKILTKNKPVAKTRFKDEVHIMETCGVDGVLPILDSFLPDMADKGYAWYAMPLGVPLLEFLRGKGPVDRISYFVRISEALVTLHSKKITHRDIKPPNIICFEDKAYLADFGLVSYPSKEDITPHREDLGPRWTMAPEILRHTHQNETRPSDVFSLAKTL